jgi:hypothetical protein
VFVAFVNRGQHFGVDATLIGCIIRVEKQFGARHEAPFCSNVKRCISARSKRYALQEVNHFCIFVLSYTKPVFVINVVQINPFVEKGFHFFMIAFCTSVIQVFVDLPRLK